MIAWLLATLLVTVKFALGLLPVPSVRLAGSAMLIWQVLTVAVVVATVDVPPLVVAVTLYRPLAAVLAFAMAGFCCVDVNPFGPLHAYVALGTVLAFN